MAILRFHVDIKGSDVEVIAMRDKIISALNDLHLTVKRMPDETRVHISAPKERKP